MIGESPIMRGRRTLSLAHGDNPRRAFHSHPYARLKYCTARSCFCAAAREENVPRFFRFPVFASFFREYKRYSPDCNFRIIQKKMPIWVRRLANKKGRWRAPSRLSSWASDD